MVKCCAPAKYRPQHLTERLTIQRLTTARTQYGGFSDTWATIATPFAMVRALGGGERWMAQRVSPHVRYRAVIRYVGDANGAPAYGAADRVTWRGREYAIEAVMDPEGDGRWMELMLVEGKDT